jgi:ribosomal protein S18 acetylase RimI-like enzyme
MSGAEDLFEIRAMERDEMDWAVDRAAAEGWNPGLQDASYFFDTDPGGFLIGTLHERPVGCISAVSYGEDFGFIGFYIVAPEFRGKGYGLSLWKAAMDRLKGRNIGLDGVVEQQDNYRKSGFRLAYRNVRYEGKPAELPKREGGLFSLHDIPSDAVEEYDRRCFPAPRTRFLARWLSMPESFGIASVDEGKLAGFGVVRRCREGYKIGPLFADDPDKAEDLFLSLSSFAGSSPIYLDVPEKNTAAVEMAEKYRMTRVFETARMYTGADPEVDLRKVFGVTTFELG